MKICVIADVHGSQKWKQIIELEKGNVDRFVFLGDYMNRKYSGATLEEQFANLKEIVAASETIPMDLLVGNHDAYHFGGVRCDGESTSKEVRNYFNSLIASGKLKVTVTYGAILFSHAGVSAVWMKEQGIKKIEMINERFKEDPLIIDFVMGEDFEPHGDNPYQSPVWIRPKSLLAAAVKKFDQVVGHTPVEKTAILSRGQLSFVFADTGFRDYNIVDTENKQIERKETNF
jgi:predicted phosphodiesterase